MQTKSELEHWYQRNDPWFYETTPDDQTRKDKILAAIPGTYKTALDVGGGEGWITKDLPAKKKYIYEISDSACERLPDNVTRVSYEKLKPVELVIATGVFYKQYDWEEMHEIVKNNATKVIVTSNIKSWEIPLEIDWKQTYYEEFPYREYTQVLRVYEARA